MLAEDVIFFLKTNPNPNDTDLHAWAEENDYDVHEVETEIYTLATKYVEKLFDEDVDEMEVV
jgi:hypothetical protein